MYCITSVNLYLIRENHTIKFQFCSSSFFLSSLADNLYFKTIVCMRILHVPIDCSATWHLHFLAWGGVRATTGEIRPRNCRLLSPKTLRVLGCRVLGLLFNYSRRDSNSQATPGLLNAWNLEVRL